MRRGVQVLRCGSAQQRLYRLEMRVAGVAQPFEYDRFCTDYLHRRLT